jgi:hypothetical protein
MSQKYAAYNGVGDIIGYYDSVDSPVPSGINAIPISDDQWKMCLQTPGGFIIKDKSLKTSTVPQSAPTGPTLIQQAKAALKSGLSVKSDVPNISSTYPVDVMSVSKAMSTSLFVNMHKKFPGNQTTLSWLDTKGIAHEFESTELFETFAKALADYAADLDAVIAGKSDKLPESMISI